MTTRAPIVARYRFHRYVAVLIAVAVPVVAVFEFSHALDGGTSLLVRLLTPVLFTIWATVVARSPRPNALPLIMSVMGFVGSLIVIEAVFVVDVTSLDFATAFGLMMVFSVLAANLSFENQFVWTGVLATIVAAWVIAVGLLDGSAADAVGTRALVSVAGIVFTTALVSELYDQLASATAAHDRATRLQEAVARCSEALLVHHDTFALYEAVRAVLEATDADYAYVDITTGVDGEPGWEIVADAYKGVSAVGGEWKVGTYTNIPSIHEALSSGRASVVHTQNLGERERKIYEADYILSEVCVPIFVGSVFRGSIGFVEYTNHRVWSEAEIQTLWRASDMIGAYWRRVDDADALRASNESKDKLLSSVSHEIRTPLTAIVGLSEEIVSGRSSMDPEVVEELDRIIAVQSRELAELVEDLLVASRADFGNLSVRAESVILADQVERVLEGMRESNPTGKTLEFIGDDTTAWADPLRVRQIIRNLISNAIKYGGDRVTVALRSHDGMAAVVVADNGSGVSEAESKLIFDRYYRSVDTPTQPGSVGIGLAVSRQLAEMMGGSLAYVPGETRHHFELVLPASADRADVRALPEYAGGASGR